MLLSGLLERKSVAYHGLSELDLCEFCVSFGVNKLTFDLKKSFSWSIHFKILNSILNAMPYKMFVDLLIKWILI